MIWREKSWILIILGIALAANTVFFFTYRVQYQSRLDDLDGRLEQAEGLLAKAKRDRAAAEASLRGYRAVEADVDRVLNEHWSTQSARLTIMIAEVKRLALASGLEPAAYSFSLAAASVARTGRASGRGTEIGVDAVGVTFSVKGNYDQIRRLMNLLELSDQFVITDQIALGAGEGDLLTLNLHLTTLFRDDTPAPPATGTNRL